MNAALCLVVLSLPAGFLAAGPAAPLPAAQAGRIDAVLPAADALSQATACMESGRPAEALALLEGILHRPRNDAEAQEALFRKGLCLHRLERPEAAAACWEQLLGRYHRTAWDEDALLGLAHIEMEVRHRPRQAQRYAERLIRNYPRSPRLGEAYAVLGQTAYQEGDYRRAQRDFESALQTAGGNGLRARAQDWLARAQAAARNTRPAPPAPRAAGRESVLSAAIAEGEALWAQGKSLEALRVFERIVKNHVWGPGYDRALFRLGHCYAAADRPEQALAAWEEALKKIRMLQAGEVAADCLLAQADTWLNALDRPERARACAERLLADYPESGLRGRAEHLLGLCWLQEGACAKALAIFEEERARRPPPDPNAPPSGLDRLIAACRGQGPVTGLIRPSAGDRWVRLGDLHFAGQEYDKARRAYHRAVQAEPGTESAAYALLQEGRCWNQARQYRKALRCYDAFLTAYKASQYADDALLRAGVIHVGPLHDAAKGARLYTTILERYPDSNAAETALYHLATLAFWDRDWERARDAHERFLAHYPHGRYADFVRKQRLPAIQMALTR